MNEWKSYVEVKTGKCETKTTSTKHEDFFAIECLPKIVELFFLFMKVVQRYMFGTMLYHNCFL